MSNNPQGSSGGPPLPSYSSSQNPGASIYRRSSYASVLSGLTRSTSPPTFHPSHRSLSAAQIMNTSTGSLVANASSHPSRNTPRGTETDGQGGLSSSRSREGTTFPATFGSFGGFGANSSENNKNDPSKPPFFIPSYLRGSRYAERLEDAHKATLRAQHESRSPHTSNPGSLSTSSSSINLHKMVPSHRGMTHDIIERAPPPVFAEENLAPLPARWSDTEKSNGMEVLGGGLEIKYSGPSKTQDEAAAIRADHPMPRQAGIYYYEVTVVSKGKDGLISIGFSGPKVALNRLPGWEPDSWAYHSDDGIAITSTSPGRPYGPKYSSGDVIGCGVNFRTGNCFFTKNGNHLGKAFDGIRGSQLYPSVGIKKPQEHLRANFGQTPFIFDIDSMIEQERLAVMEEINRTDVSILSPPLDERQLIHRLIAQYLAHESYVDTAKAFADEVRAENKALTGGNATDTNDLEPEEDHDAANRQKIRAAILEGDVDFAISFTSSCYPSVLTDNENIYFRLRCRKFIEMIKRCTELQDASDSSVIPKRMHASNGRVHDDYDVFDHQMELDEQLGAHHTHNGTVVEDWESAMDTSEDPVMSADKLLVEAIEYGQELKAEFSNDPRKEVKRALEETLALIAYSDPRESPLKRLLGEGERVPVAEELNNAVLVSLGKSPASALERVVQQTVVLLNELGEDGGPGAFINISKTVLNS